MLTDLPRALREATDPMLLMQRVVEESLALIDSAAGAAVEVVHGDHLIYTCAAGTLARHVGLRLLIDRSLSGASVRTLETLTCTDSERDERVDAAACRAVGARSMVCVPLHRGRDVVGVLKVCSPEPDAFDPMQIGTLNRLAEFVTEAIAGAANLARLIHELVETAPGRRAEGPDDAVGQFVANVLHPGIVASAEARARVDEVLAVDALRVVFQPIVDLDRGRVAGHEALARFPGGASPDVWFADAHRVGLGVDLEVAAVRHALAGVAALPPGTSLAINVGPELARSRQLLELIDASDPTRVVVELTEHARIDDYPSLCAALDDLRRRGVRLAIDDTGTGYSGLAHILRLTPDIIKLDRTLTTGIDLDPVRRALAAALVSFADDSDAVIVAEGIETAAELAAVRELGIRFGQGYLLGRPRPTPLRDEIGGEFPGTEPLARTTLH